MTAASPNNGRGTFQASDPADCGRAPHSVLWQTDTLLPADSVVHTGCASASQPLVDKACSPRMCARRRATTVAGTPSRRRSESEAVKQSRSHGCHAPHNGHHPRLQRERTRELAAAATTTTITMTAIRLTGSKSRGARCGLTRAA